MQDQADAGLKVAVLVACMSLVIGGVGELLGAAGAFWGAAVLAGTMLMLGVISRAVELECRR